MSRQTRIIGDLRGGGSGWRIVNRFTLGVAGGFLWTVPAGYFDLRIEIAGRGNVAVTAADVLMRVNGVSTSNYDTSYNGKNTADSATIGHHTGSSSSEVGPGFPGTSAQANAKGKCVIEIYNYHDATFYPCWTGRSGCATNAQWETFTTDGQLGIVGAITQVEVNYSSWGNGFVAGTVGTLLGRGV